MKELQRQEASTCVPWLANGPGSWLVQEELGPEELLYNPAPSAIFLLSFFLSSSRPPPRSIFTSCCGLFLLPCRFDYSSILSFLTRLSFRLSLPDDSFQLSLLDDFSRLSRLDDFPDSIILDDYPYSTIMTRRSHSLIEELHPYYYSASTNFYLYSDSSKTSERLFFPDGLSILTSGSSLLGHLLNIRTTILTTPSLLEQSSHTEAGTRAISTIFKRLFYLTFRAEHPTPATTLMTSISPY